MFKVAAGEHLGFLRPNRPGNPRAVKILCTLARPDLQQDQRGQPRHRQQSRTRFAAISASSSQDRTLDDYLTGARTSSFHAQLKAVPSAAVRPRLKTPCSTSSGCWDRRDSLVRLCSAGVQRGQPITRALLPRARTLLFLDGPTVGLDPRTRFVGLGDRQPTQEQGRHHDLPDHTLHERGQEHYRPDHHHRPPGTSRPSTRPRRSRPTSARTRSGSRPPTTAATIKELRRHVSA